MKTNFSILSDPNKIYSDMIKDILAAKKSIYLESYIFNGDRIGKMFLNALTLKAKEGLEIRILLDDWGTNVPHNFFNSFTSAGGKVKFFRKFLYVLKIFGKNHERNHKKILIIDEKVCYVGSCNITADCLNWRELVLRLEGSFAKHFTSFFNYTWENKSKINADIKKILKGKFQIIQDIPKDLIHLTENKYLELINSAQKEILIETPYFVPSFRLRRAIYQAMKRGVKVKLLLPNISDVKILDIIRNRYIGRLNKKGVEIYFFKPGILHSKLLIVDNYFLMGSSNFDYRSFVHQYELNLFGEDPEIVTGLKEHFNRGIKESIPFNYSNWKKRSAFSKFLEAILKRFEEYL